MIFDRLTATESLFEAWFAFRRGKMRRKDVQQFSRHAEREIFALQRRLRAGTYQHGSYRTFCVRDPKIRTIRKATVVDRVVHQALYTELTRMYDSRFLPQVYSGRAGTGVHAGVSAVERTTWRVSKNYSRPCYYLKCDIRKFYDSVDHEILLSRIRDGISDERMCRLIEVVVRSFHTDNVRGKGLPIGNLTSQIFTNIYLRPLDVFIAKHVGASSYARFADDFVILSHDLDRLTAFRETLQDFLMERCRLALHPQKVVVAPLHHGLDFLGYVLLPRYRRVRAKTLRRVFRRLSGTMARCFTAEASHSHLLRSISSYEGVLSHANTFRVAEVLRAQFFVRPLVCP